MKLGSKENIAFFLLMLLLLPFSVESQATTIPSSLKKCFEEASRKYKVQKSLLYAIAYQESRFDPNAVNINRNGTFDVGIMQINTVWIKELKNRYGVAVSVKKIAEPCINIKMGAYILRGLIEKEGGRVTYNVIGSYNAGPGGNPKTKLNYARKVVKIMRKIQKVLD